MNPQNLTQEQQTEIMERLEKGLAALKELDLIPSAQVAVENIGDNKFVNSVQPYLQDIRYTKITNSSTEEVAPEVIPAEQSEESEKGE